MALVIGCRSRSYVFPESAACACRIQMCALPVSCAYFAGNRCMSVLKNGHISQLMQSTAAVQCGARITRSMLYRKEMRYAASEI